MEEEWRDIEGYIGSYRVSNFGRVWSIINNKELKGRIRNKYLFVTLYKEDTKAYQIHIHRLVALHFLAPPPNDGNIYEVDHIDPYQKTNNRVDNLRWVTRSENQHNRKMFKKGYLIMGVNWSTKSSLPSPCYRVHLREMTEWKVFPTKYERHGYSKEEAKELARQEANRDIVRKMIDLGKHRMETFQRLSPEERQKYFGDPTFLE